MKKPSIWEVFSFCMLIEYLKSTYYTIFNIPYTIKRFHTKAAKLTAKSAKSAKNFVKNWNLVLII
jgi:hypothetical protein